MKIQLLQHTEIDKKKWDERVRASENGLIYSYSWYLDCVAPGWKALTTHNYSFIMPVPVRRKAFFEYVFQPPFCQQLGIIGETPLTTEIIHSFIHALTSRFSVIGVNLNFSIQIHGLPLKTNLLLDLSDSFDTIRKGFRKDLLSVASKNKLQIQSTEPKSVIDFFMENKGKELASVKKTDLKALYNLCNILNQHHQLHCKEVISETSENLSKAMFFEDEKRIYYILSATSESGKRVGANPFLIAETIREFSQRNLWFDFEGSSIPSIQFFFKKFNPQTELYPVLQQNNLPPLIKRITSLIRR